MFDIFVSCSSSDVEAVDSLSADVQRAGLRVRISEAPADSETVEILERLRGCAVLLWAVSDESLQSELCRIERQCAEALGIPVVAVRVGEVARHRNDVPGGAPLDYRRGAARLPAVVAVPGRRAALGAIRCRRPGWRTAR
ncbi:TIR domain-containing protein [Mycolicibacterium thermoresistibile]